MSIATSLAALRQAKTDIAAAITNKGGAVNTGDGFADFAADIATISAGSEIQTASGLTVRAGKYVFTITGLSFQPRLVSYATGCSSSTNILGGYMFLNEDCTVQSSITIYNITALTNQISSVVFNNGTLTITFTNGYTLPTSIYNIYWACAG